MKHITDKFVFVVDCFVRDSAMTYVVLIDISGVCEEFSSIHNLEQNILQMAFNLREHIGTCFTIWNFRFKNQLLNV